MMVPRTAAASLVSENRALAWRLRQEQGATLGAGTAAALAWVEGRLATLGEDQAPSNQIELIAQGIGDGSLGAAVSAIAGAPRRVLSR